jgi:uncharacterized protein (DUF1697 family)
MARLVALLRGINLGAKRRIAMADLRALVSDLGYSDVRTVLGSGNAVFTGPQAKAREKLEAGLAERFGFDVDVILRTMDELHAVVEADPFGAEATVATRYFVVFLDAAPDADALGKLMDQDFSPDRLAANGRELYAWCPDGMQGSRLMKALGKPGLAGTATVRNWSTVNKLLES